MRAARRGKQFPCQPEIFAQIPVFGRFLRAMGPLGAAKTAQLGKYCPGRIVSLAEIADSSMI
jgi:hypothetical protein